MTTPNPYESPTPEAKSGSWSPIEFLVIGVWIVLPLGVLVSRRIFLPLFEDFGLELPTVTRYLLHFNTQFVAAVISIPIVITLFLMPAGTIRRQFFWLAGVLRLLIGVVACLSLASPLLTLWRGLN